METEKHLEKPEERSIKLNENQLLAAQMLASGNSGKTVAERLGVAPETVSRWRQEPEFKTELNSLLHKIRGNVSQRLNCLMSKALEGIEEAFDDPNLKPKEKCMIGLKLLELCRVKEISVDVTNNPDFIKLKEYEKQLLEQKKQEY